LGEELKIPFTSFATPEKKKAKRVNQVALQELSLTSCKKKEGRI